MESSSFLAVTLDYILFYWWMITPFLLFFILRDVWVGYKIAKTLSEINWIFLEIRLPRPLLRTTKAMDHMLTALHVIHAGELNFADKYIEGKVQEWFSFEIVGSAAGVRFLIRTSDKYKNLVEAQVYAHYPSAEVREVDDYTQYLPAVIPNGEYDIWGTELALIKPDPYPILTYPYFEDKDEERNIDPLSSLLETLSLLRDGEHAWIQILAKPIDDKFNNWKEEGQKVVAKMAGREVKSKSKGPLMTFKPEMAISFVPDTLDTLLGGKAGEVKEKKEERQKEIKLTPGEEVVAKALEANISKFAYETQIRIVYVAPVNVFSKAQGAALMGSFKQFNSQHLNGFKPGKGSKLKGEWYSINKDMIAFRKKQALYAMYKQRMFRVPFGILGFKPKNNYSFVLSTEELATIFHFPTGAVSAPAVARVDAKKGEPPPILPIME